MNRILSTLVALALVAGAAFATDYHAITDTDPNAQAYPSADATKVGHISVTQAVDLDTIESDTAANNAKVTYPSGDATKVGFLTVTQAVDLDTLEVDVTANNAKITYPSGDATKVGYLTVTQAVDLDTMESDVTANNAKNTYPSGDSTKVGFISITQAVDLDDVESKANSALQAEADTLADVTGRGATSATPITLSGLFSLNTTNRLAVMGESSTWVDLYAESSGGATQAVFQIVGSANRTLVPLF